MKYTLNFKEFGEYAVLIEWPSEINESILDEILKFQQQAGQHFKNKNFEYIPSYTTLTIIDVSKQLKASELKHILQSLVIEDSGQYKVQRNLWKIPVCYDASFAPDMDLLCDEKKLTPAQIIKQHTEATYTIYCMGFLPGFMYLGGLPEALHFRRKSTPRLSVMPGSVGIGGNQTGIYPQESPGGWNLIGNCPVKLFNINNMPPCFVKVGDKVKFYEISRPEYDIIDIKVQTGIYEPEKEVWND